MHNNTPNHTKKTGQSAFFSDETERFRSPAEPEAGQTVTIRLRAPLRDDLFVWLVTDARPEAIPMQMREEKGFGLFEACFTVPERPVSYHFRIFWQGQYYAYRKTGLKVMEVEPHRGYRFDFRFTPGFHTPAWARGAVQYQIFPDRFCNGDAHNDVLTGEYSYNGEHVRRITPWGKIPAQDDYRCFYGGDLQGILDKLDYLQDLGVEVLYLNPIFLSPSSHKYDAQDYEHIDPHFGVIVKDEGRLLHDWEQHNGFAERYISRVLSEENLQASDALFARLCEELHRRGMRIILDGVFNHCGSFHRWMDREGIYRDKPGFAPGAAQSKRSPYRDYFHFGGKGPGYEAWWGVETLPKLCYEQSPALCEAVFSVAEKWLKPPYCIDGWRLDVAADLGHSPAFNHSFWREFRRRVKRINPEAIILAEHYGDASSWLRGDQWDSVMNYDAFMEPVTGFLTGMEKHSDARWEEMYQNGPLFFTVMREKMAQFPRCSLDCAMNELSNHDHSRFLTRTNRRVGRLQSLGARAASEGINPAVMREAVVIQMTWPGAPTIYYGDEAGLTGWTDPDNRRCYPWGHEDKGLIALHRALIQLRRQHPVLRLGSVREIGAGFGWIAYARFDGDACLVTACNNREVPEDVSLRLSDAGAADGERFVSLLRTDERGFSAEPLERGAARDGELHLTMPPHSAAVLAKV